MSTGAVPGDLENDLAALLDATEQAGMAADSGDPEALAAAMALRGSLAARVAAAIESRARHATAAGRQELAAALAVIDAGAQRLDARLRATMGLAREEGRHARRCASATGGYAVSSNRSGAMLDRSR